MPNPNPYADPVPAFFVPTLADDLADTRDQNTLLTSTGNFGPPPQGGGPPNLLSVTVANSDGSRVHTESASLEMGPWTQLMSDPDGIADLIQYHATALAMLHQAAKFQEMMGGQS